MTHVPSVSLLWAMNAESDALNAVSVINDQWCWKSKIIDIEVVDKDLVSIDFTQTGFMLSASLSHSILLVSGSAVGFVNAFIAFLILI